MMVDPRSDAEWAEYAAMFREAFPETAAEFDAFWAAWCKEVTDSFCQAINSRL
jgi:uncharacterized protein (DUF2236 family)